MDKKKLKEILKDHREWLRSNGNEGERAVLHRASLRDADLQNADLRYADLRGADLCGANLIDADLDSACLHDANLRGTILCSANLYAADLQGADLSDADLYGADLQAATLCDANLHGANLCNANWHNADLPCGIVQVGPIGSRKDYTIYRVDEDIVQCGCWHGTGREEYEGGTLAEFEKRIDEIYPADNKAHIMHRAEYIGAIKMFESMREAYLKSKEGKNKND